ncbi:MAG: HlyD family secretion protein [Vicinamibacterales bacterium]
MRSIVSLLFLPVAIAGCDRDPPDNRMRVSGHVEVTEVRIAPDIGGRVLELAVDEGKRLAAGDLVVRLDTRDAELALQQAKAEHAAAEAQLRLLKAGSRNEDIRGAAAQLAATRADLATAQAELASAERDLERFEALLESRAGSVKQRDDAATRRDVARERVAGARERGRAADETLSRVRAGARREEIEAASARADSAAAQVAAIAKTIADATLLSPVSGIVTEKLVEQGEVIAPRTTVAIVADLDHAWADVFVSGPSIPRLRLGQSARIFTDAGGAGLEGRVTWISPKAEFTPRNVQTADERSKLVYRVRITVDNSQGVLKQGMPVDAELELVAPEQ